MEIRPSKWPYIWLIAALLFCLAASRSFAASEKPPANSPLSQSAQQGSHNPPPPAFMYLPGVVYGDAHSKNMIGYYWSASDQASIDSFNKYIAPLIRKLLNQPNVPYSVTVYQILEDNKHDAIGPGGLLLCPNTHKQYEALAIDYLLYGREVAETTPLSAFPNDVHSINKSLRDLGRRRGINFHQCVLNGKYYLRLFRVVGDSIAHDVLYQHPTYPIFVFDNAVVSAGDPRLNTLQELAAQP